MGVVLLILKILGIMILCLLLLILIVLIAPIKYNIIGNKYNKFDFDAKITWIFSIISVQYVMRDDYDDLIIKVPFIGKKLNDQEYGKENPVSVADVPAEIHNIENVETTKKDKPLSEKQAESFDKEFDIFKESKITHFFKDVIYKINEFIQRIKILVGEIIKYKNIAMDFDREFGIKRTVAVTFKLIINMLRTIKPKIFNVSGIIGFDDPANTGIILGAIAAVNPYVPGDINIEGDFNNKIISGNLILKGRTNLLFILIPVIKYIFAEPIWSVIKKYWRDK